MNSDASYGNSASICENTLGISQVNSLLNFLVVP